MKKEILVVDDSKANQMAIQFQLVLYGLNVETANNGSEALEKAKLKEYDLIFSDLEMPVMNGLQLLAKIRR